jgi:hypothetical protein
MYVGVQFGVLQLITPKEYVRIKENEALQKSACFYSMKPRPARFDSLRSEDSGSSCINYSSVERMSSGRIQSFDAQRSINFSLHRRINLGGGGGFIFVLNLSKNKR